MSTCDRTSAAAASTTPTPHRPATKRSKTMAIILFVAIVVVTSSLLSSCSGPAAPNQPTGPATLNQPTSQATSVAAIDPDGPNLSDAQVTQVLNSKAILAWTAGGQEWTPSDVPAGGGTAQTCAELKPDNKIVPVTNVWTYGTLDGSYYGLVGGARQPFAVRSCPAAIAIIDSPTYDYAGKHQWWKTDMRDVGLIVIGWTKPSADAPQELDQIGFYYGNMALTVWMKDKTASTPDDAMKLQFDGRTSDDIMNDLVTTVNAVAAGEAV